MVGLFRALAAVAPETIFVGDAVDLMEEAHTAGVHVGTLTNHAYSILEPSWFASRPELASLRTFIDAAAIGFPKPDPRRVSARRCGARRAS